MRKVLPDNEFKNLIEVGYESRNIEYKSPFIWNSAKSLWLQEKVIRSVLGFANKRDGGDIIIGIEEKEGSAIKLTGMKDVQIDSFNYDDIKSSVDSFASPYVEFDIIEGRHDGKKFLVIRVREFDEMPIVCKKDGQHTDKILKLGDIYCRAGSGSPATIEVTEKELREILDLAVDKKQKALTRRGYKIAEIDSSEVKNLFREQIKDIAG